MYSWSTSWKFDTSGKGRHLCSTELRVSRGQTNWCPEGKHHTATIFYQPKVDQLTYTAPQKFKANSSPSPLLDTSGKGRHLCSTELRVSRGQTYWCPEGKHHTATIFYQPTNLVTTKNSVPTERLPCTPKCKSQGLTDSRCNSRLGVGTGSSRRSERRPCISQFNFLSLAFLAAILATCTKHMQFTHARLFLLTSSSCWHAYMHGCHGSAHQLKGKAWNG